METDIWKIRIAYSDGCFIMLSQSNLFCRFYSEYKQRHKDEYQSDISHPYKYPDS